MRNRLALLILAVLGGIVIWQLCLEDPVIPRVVLAFILVLLALLAGLRVGTDYALRFTDDLERKNKYLAEENSALADLNLQYLKEFTEVKAPNDH